jgi:hypothetical protein
MSFIPGANVGQYRIVEQAERNGVATTYTAYQPTLGRYVAISVVPSIDRDDASLQRQYQRQIALIAEFRNPNVLTVLDHGEHLGVSYTVTELIEAEPLAERLGAPWPLSEVVRVVRPIAAALDAAHAQGIVHGDVRPSTVLVMPDGTPILAGLGLSTRPFGAPAGTPDGEPGRRTPAVAEETARAQQGDRRGLALIAFEMLTGRTMDVDGADIDEPLPPAQLGGSPLLVPPVERALLRELTGPATERYATASAFVDDLAMPLAPARPVEPVPAPVAVNVAETTATSAARRRLLTVLAIFVALAILGALALMLRGGDATRPVAAPGRGTEADASPTAAAGGVAAGGSAAGVEVSPVAGSGGPGSAAAGASPGTATGASSISAVPTRAGSSITLVVSTPAVTAAAPPAAQGSGSGAGTSGAAAPTRPAGAALVAQPSSSPLVVTVPATPAAVPTVRPATTPLAVATAGSTRLPATWRVVGDPSGRWILDEQARVAGRTETGASVVLFPEAVDDINFSALVSTSTCQATLVFRAQDDENLLMAIYIPDGLPNPGAAGGGVWLYQRVEGLDIPIRAVRPSTVATAGEAVRLKIVTSGPQITILLNDEPTLQAVDTAPRSGRLGMMVYSTSGRPCEATFGDIQR